MNDADRAVAPNLTAELLRVVAQINEAFRQLELAVAVRDISLVHEIAGQLLALRASGDHLLELSDRRAAIEPIGEALQ